MNVFDYIVVGAGINGSWTAYHLSKAGFSTLLLDQFPLPHSRGSSHGQSRGIRRAYPQRYLCEMMDDAYEQWHQLEKDTRTSLMKETGLLCFGDQNERFINEIIDTFRSAESSAKYEVLSSADLRSRYPSLRLGSSVIGVLDPSGGVLMADKCLKAVQASAVASGCTIVDNLPITNIQPGSIVTVSGEKRSYRGKGVVICAGPWTNQLVQPLGLSYPLKPIKIPVYYFPYRDFIPHTWITETADGHFWGLPDLEYKGKAKICSHFGPLINPDNRDEADCSEVKKAVQKTIKNLYPGVSPLPAIEEACIYTVTPDEVHILDVHPRHKNIVVGCGFSGTGFKLGPVTGEMLADLVLGRKSRFDMTPFQAARFARL